MEGGSPETPMSQRRSRRAKELDEGTPPPISRATTGMNPYDFSLLAPIRDLQGGQRVGGGGERDQAAREMERRARVSLRRAAGATASHSRGRPPGRTRRAGWWMSSKRIVRRLWNR